MIGMILLACIVLTVIQAALSVLVIVGILLLIVGVFYRPAETFGLLMFGAFSTLLQTHPVGCIWLITLMLIVAFFKRKRGGQGPEDHTPKTITYRPSIK
jgi:hypothetical protein